MPTRAFALVLVIGCFVFAASIAAQEGHPVLRGPGPATGVALRHSELI
jgi:hypothetical protein